MKLPIIITIILTALFVFTSQNTYSQCTPNTSIVELGVSPDTLTTGCVGEDFSESFTLVFMDDTVVMGFTLPIDSIVITGFNNVPTGVTAQCGTSNCTMYYSPTKIYGCITLSGSRLAQHLNDSIEILLTEYITFFGTPTSIIDSRFIRFTMFENIDTSVAQVTNTLAAATTGVSYRWLNCGDNFAVIPGETSSTYTATLTGSFAVELSNGNCTDTSGCHLVVVDNILENGYRIQAYPNPASERFTLDLPMTMQNVSVKIYNTLGVQVFESNFNEAKSIELPIDFNAGIYLIELSSENQLIYRDRICVN